MMTDKYEAIQIVETLNEELFEKLGEKVYDEYPSLNFEYQSIGYAEAIEFLGHQIWCSEDDQRLYINENTPAEDYEPLENYLRREASKLCKLISNIDLEDIDE